MKFSEMPYKRVEVDEARERSEAIRRNLAEASSYEEARAAFMEQQKLETEIETQYALVYVRHSIDTADSFYDAENEYWDSANPMLQEFSQKFTEELLKTPFRDERLFSSRNSGRKQPYICICQADCLCSD